MTEGRQLPEGELTLMFTDIEGSTRLLHEIGDLYGEVLAEHDHLLRDICQRFDGVVVKTEGDSFFVVFLDVNAAVAAAVAAQQSLVEHAWPHRGVVRVRIGLHTGTPRLRRDDYWGVDVHYAARLAAAASGGQVLISGATRSLVPDAPVDDLGEHALRDFPAPRRLFHLRVAGRRASDFPPPKTVDRVGSNLPSPPNRLIGREHEIDLIRTALTGDARLLTLTGVGGSGKTRLAIAAGAALVDCFSDGVFFVGVASLGEESLVPAAIAYGLGAPVENTLVAERAVLEYLRGKDVLLIVDNMEHLLGAAPVLSSLLEALPKLRILVTSQAPLRLRSEIVMPLGPLDAALGSELFFERARSLDPTFGPNADNSAAVAELCRRLDGLPLALELAAARVRLVGPRQLLAALEAGLDALGAGDRDLPARQRGLRAALDYTVSLLHEEPRRLFAGLGAFADAWTIEQLEQMFASELDVWDAMAVLLDYSLIRTRGDGRFVMAEPVRSYSVAVMESEGRDQDYRSRHARMLARESELIDDAFLLETTSMTAKTIELVGECTAALHWARDHDATAHRRLAAALGIPYYLCGRFSLVADDIVALARTSSLDDGVAARLHIAYATVLITRDEVDASFDAARLAVKCYRRLGDERREAVALAVYAHLTSQAGRRVDDVSELLQASLRTPVVQGDPALKALLLGELGINHFTWGRLVDADDVLSRIVTDPGLAGSFIAYSAMTWWGDCAMVRGQFDVALERFAACLAQEPVYPHASLNALVQCLEIAGALAGLGRDSEAIELASATEAVVEREALGSLREWYSTLMLALFAASRARLGETEADRVRQRGEALDFESLVRAALAFAGRYEPGTGTDTDPRPHPPSASVLDNPHR